MEYAAELIARGQILRVAYGSVVQINPHPPRKLGAPMPAAPRYMAVAVRKLKEPEREWLAAYQRAAAQHRREQREVQRRLRRGQA